MILARLGRPTASVACFLLLTLLAGAALAGEVEQPDERVIVLDAFVTLGQRELLDPLDWPGLPGDFLETPRSLARISLAQLRDHGVERMEDLSLFVAGASNATLYGIAGVPVIRGDLGDVAQNGQRKAFNRNAFPISLNAVESVDVVSGAAPVVLGYATGTGGMANFVTKRPSFGTNVSSVTVAAGSWGDFRAQVDATGPLSESLAWRISIERAEAGGFHRLAREDSWNGYLALSWLPDGRSAGQQRWDFSAETYSVRFVENPGINRPTQALIDRGEYITGSSVQNGGAGSYRGNTFTPTGVVQLDGAQVLISPGDDGWARAFTVQLVGSVGSNPKRRITSRTMFENVAGEKYMGYTFYSYFPRSRTLEQRIEVSQQGDWGGVGHELLWGAAVRGEERLGYVDFLNAAINAFDLTLDPATYVFPVEQLFGVRSVPGRPGRFAVSGARYPVAPTAAISQTLHSRLLNAGVFAQDVVSVTERLKLTLGGRLDAVSVKSEDPLPPAGFAPVSGSMAGFLPAGTVGITWHSHEWSTVYLTWQRAAAVESSSGTGGFGLTNNRLPEELFENASELVEAGIKFTAPGGRLSGSAALYRQQRHRTNPRQRRPDEILVRGIEATVEWRAGESWILGGNFTTRNARYLDGPLPRSIATVPYFDPAIPSGTFGAFAPGDYRLPGLPRWQANVFATWFSSRGIGARLWGSLQGRQNLDLFGHVVIPAQTTWNAGVFYRRNGFEAGVHVLNFTDEFNWRPTSTPFAGADLVTRELPRSWRVTVRQSF